MSPRARLARQHAARRARVWLVVGAGAMTVLAAGAVLLVTGSGSGDDGAGAAAGGLRISMTEFAFEPDPLVLATGDGASLEVVNDGEVAHDLVIGELGKGTPDLAPGASMVLDLSDQPAGTYRVLCDLPGHTEAGMVTELTLE